MKGHDVLAVLPTMASLCYGYLQLCSIGAGGEDRPIDVRSE